MSLAGVCGILVGTISSVLESIGDYYACALQSGAEVPPSHAINRGDETCHPHVFRNIGFYFVNTIQ